MQPPRNQPDLINSNSPRLAREPLCPTVCLTHIGLAKFFCAEAECLDRGARRMHFSFCRESRDDSRPCTAFRTLHLETGFPERLAGKHAGGTGADAADLLLRDRRQPEPLQITQHFQPRHAERELIKDLRPVLQLTSPAQPFQIFRNDDCIAGIQALAIDPDGIFLELVGPIAKQVLQPPPQGCPALQIKMPPKQDS